MYKEFSLLKVFHFICLWYERRLHPSELKYISREYCNTVCRWEYWILTFGFTCINCLTFICQATSLSLSHLKMKTFIIDSLKNCAEHNPSHGPTSSCMVFIIIMRPNEGFTIQWWIYKFELEKVVDSCCFSNGNSKFVHSKFKFKFTVQVLGSGWCSKGKYNGLINYTGMHFAYCINIYWNSEKIL